MRHGLDPGGVHRRHLVDHGEDRVHLALHRGGLGGAELQPGEQRDSGDLIEG
jgi:hypothetical protein